MAQTKNRRKAIIERENNNVWEAIDIDQSINRSFPSDVGNSTMNLLFLAGAAIARVLANPRFGEALAIGRIRSGRLPMSVVGEA